MGDHTGCCCAEFSNSISQNPRIRSNNRTKTGNQEGKTGQVNQEKQQHRERGRQDTTAQQSYLIHIQILFSLVRRNSYTITSSLLRTRHVFLDPYSSTIAKLLTNCTAAAACHVSSSCWHCGTRWRSCCFVQGHHLFFY